jgi:hypothetical protein
MTLARFSERKAGGAIEHLQDPGLELAAAACGRSAPAHVGLRGDCKPHFAHVAGRSADRSRGEPVARAARNCRRNSFFDQPCVAARSSQRSCSGSSSRKPRHGAGTSTCPAGGTLQSGGPPLRSCAASGNPVPLPRSPPCSGVRTCPFRRTASRPTTRNSRWSAPRSAPPVPALPASVPRPRSQGICGTPRRAAKNYDGIVSPKTRRDCQRRSSSNPDHHRQWWDLQRRANVAVEERQSLPGEQRGSKREGRCPYA